MEFNPVIVFSILGLLAIGAGILIWAILGRVLIIGISALCGGLLFIWLFGIKFPVDFPDWLALLLFGGSCVLGGAVAWHFCGRPNLKPTDFSRTDYEQLGLLVSEEFSVRRAFEVEEYEDEGLHFSWSSKTAGSFSSTGSICTITKRSRTIRR